MTLSTCLLFRRAAKILVPFVPSANLRRQTCADPAQFRRRPLLLPGLLSGPGTARRQRTRLERGSARRGKLSASATDSVGGPTAQVRTAGLAAVGTVLQEAPAHRRAVPRRDAREAAAGRRRGAGVEALRALEVARRSEGEGITVPRGLEPRASQPKRTVGASAWRRRWLVGDDGTAADSTGRSAVVADGLTPVDQRLRD